MSSQIVDYGFEKALDEFVGMARYNAIRYIRKMQRRLLHLVAVQTPVDSGMARASWNLSVGKPRVVVRTPPKGGWSATEALQKAKSLGGDALAKFKDPVGQTIYLTNGAPHIDLLEHGGTDRWGNQIPPQKMLATARMRIEHETFSE